MKLSEHIQKVKDEIPLFDPEVLMEDMGIVEAYGGNQEQEAILAGLHKQRHLTESDKCILCEREIYNSETQIAMVQAHGLSALFCGGTCLLRYYAMQWLTDQFDGIIEDIEMIAQVPITQDQE